MENQGLPGLAGSAGETPAAAKEGEYVVVARRYRPQKFAELVGQEHVARALSAAIATNRVGHAYLFTGAGRRQDLGGADSRQMPELHARPGPRPVRSMR